MIVASDHGELPGDGGLHHIFTLRDGTIKYPYTSNIQMGHVLIQLLRSLRLSTALCAYWGELRQYFMSSGSSSPV